ncbi:CHASE2 domain-containing protein [Stutzerimonas stutzeri]|uniref:CHASE2 domain-containing protein n=1 Tax=Stutzerimonas stutzeri TaxID=316 RepID=UPI0015E3623C|nr:adenylate/guanylate cyclase domain-containing protein [Stutzerimonas stutzeri]MBA1264977.1 adenylate/guanylate cyclase domain-containing protein [Stutzerimonas stutzeri]
MPRLAAFTRLGLALAVFCLCILLEGLRPPLIERLDEGVRDAVLQHAAVPELEGRVLLVDVDEESIRRLGNWPWSRALIADLIEVLLADYGARAIGLDIVFTEPGDALGDARLAMLAQHAPLALAQIMDFTPRQPPLFRGHLTPPYQPEAALQEELTVAKPAYGFIGNHAVLSEAARCVGNIGYLPDADGVLRHLPVHSLFDGQRYPLFALALLECAANPPPAGISLPQPSTAGLWRVPFRYSASAYVVIPAHEILTHTAPVEMVKGRHVIVGASAMSLGDRVSTPLDPLTTGALVHAQSVSALLDAAHADAPSPKVTWLLSLWLLLSMVLAAHAFSRLAASGSLLLLSALCLSWMAIAIVGTRQGATWPFFTPLAGYVLLFLLLVPYEWRLAQRQSRKVLETLSHYVAKPVLDELTRQGLVYSLVPVHKEITVLIADMEGYTRNTSALELEAAAQLTKGFLDCLTRPVLEHGGTLDRYTGDGVVAFWGAPLACPDQADEAVSAALQILEEIEIFNKRRLADGLEAVRVRIGIENGQALVGDLGTPFRSTYTAVGDCINFASRLEAAARELPVSLVIGASANQKLQRHQTYAVGTLQVRGTNTVIEIFSPVQSRPAFPSRRIAHATPGGVGAASGP